MFAMTELHVLWSNLVRSFAAWDSLYSITPCCRAAVKCVSWELCRKDSERTRENLLSHGVSDPISLPVSVQRLGNEPSKNEITTSILIYY